MLNKEITSMVYLAVLDELKTVWKDAKPYMMANCRACKICNSLNCDMVTSERSGSAERNYKCLQSVRLIYDTLYDGGDGTEIDSSVELYGHSLIRQLREHDCCIIYISHKFDEIFEICDSVTVLRDGVAVWTRPTKEVSNEDLTHAVIGRHLDQYYPQLPPAPSPDAEKVLEVEHFKNKKLDDVSISLRKGEILGLFGLVGAGRSELLRAIFGLDSVYSGKILIKGKPCKIQNSHQAMKNGIGFLTENRREEGLILKMNIKHNLTMPILRRVSIPVIGTLRFKIERKMVADAFKRFLIKAEGPNQRAGHLSGGNQQKVVLSKWMMTDAPVLMLDEPTRGVDIGAKAEIYELITRLIEETGSSVILVSSEAPEILGISHRILVMRDGKVIAEHASGEVTEEELVLECARGVGNEE